MGCRCHPGAFRRTVVEKHTMTLSRRALLSASLALPLAMPALRRAAADPVAQLALLHMNDFHSKHEGTDAGSASCRTDKPCLGGSARLAGAMAMGRRDATADGRAVLQLDGGDQFMGSLFYTAHKGRAESAVQRVIGTEAMTLGNHEFDNGPAVLADYAKTLAFPLLSANLDFSKEPLLAGLVKPYTVIERGGARIGIIGVTTETTPQLSSPGPTVAFRSATEAVERNIAALRAERPTTIIVLSHLGFTEDQKLAAAVPGIDVIVGAHSHTLLANRLSGAESPHPTLVDSPDRAVRIVQAACYGRYLGRLDLDLTGEGRVAAHAGEVREITPDIAPDEKVAAIVAEYAAPLEGWRRRPVGTLAEALSLQGCREGECAIGNLMAEAMLAAEPTAEVAVTNGGGLRAGLPAGTVTWGDVLTVLPFSNTLASLTIRGGALRQALENGLSLVGQNAGRFPQVAGMRFTFDAAAPAGQRVRDVQVRLDGRFMPLDPDRAYRVVTNNFMRRGGDGYVPFQKDALEAYDAGPALEDTLVKYMETHPNGSWAPDGRVARSP
jgi:5'-nucleotidase